MVKTVTVTKPTKIVQVKNGKVVVFDDRWITINADEEEGRKGQHVLIKENGTIVYGLGGKYKHLRELGGKKSGRNYESELAKGLGKEHYDAIRDRLDKCGDKEFIDFWNATENGVAVGTTTEKGREHASFNAIYVDLEKDAGGEWYKDPYATTVHESGHAIDYHCGFPTTTGGGYFSAQYKNGLFGQTLIQEVNEHIEKLHTEMKQAFKEHGRDYKWLHKHGYINDDEKKIIERYERLGRLDEYYPLTYRKSMAYSKFEEDVRAEGKNGNYSWWTMADILEGTTKGKIGSGHGKTYWRKMDRSYGKNAGVAMEAFAEITSATITSPETLKVIKKYIPKSYELYREMIKEMTKRGERIR